MLILLYSYTMFFINHGIFLTMVLYLIQVVAKNSEFADATSLKQCSMLSLKWTLTAHQHKSSHSEP